MLSRFTCLLIDPQGAGRVSIILWGWTDAAIEEPNAPPMIVNDTREEMRTGRRDSSARGRSSYKSKFSHSAPARPPTGNKENARADD